MSHEILPTPGEIFREDGTPGDLLRPSDYPLLSACHGCGEPVRCERWFQCDWMHVSKTEAAVARIMAAAPPLSAETKAKLAVLLSDP